MSAHRSALSGHQSARMKSATWLTPPEILAKLGAFDLDPCAAIGQPWTTARHHYTEIEDGLVLPWFGRVWCNPPFGAEAAKWLRRCREHGNAIVLVPARTETRMFFEEVWPHASGICFLRGRPHFHRIDGSRAPFNSGAPIVLIAYGRENVETLKRSDLGHSIACGATA